MTEREKILLLVLGLTGVLFILEKFRAIWLTPARGKQYDPHFEAAEIRFGLPRGILSRMAYQESRYNPSIVNPKSGAQGMLQFMPATAKELGIDPFNPYQAITGAAQYLNALYKQFGTWKLALAAYNWGPGNLARKGIARAPAETKHYYASILADIGIA